MYLTGLGDSCKPYDSDAGEVSVHVKIITRQIFTNLGWFISKPFMTGSDAESELKVLETWGIYSFWSKLKFQSS